MFDGEKLELLRRFNVYALMFYVPNFLTATQGVDAPFYDLQVIKRLNKFKSVDEVLATKALETMENHYWYLCGPG